VTAAVILTKVRIHEHGAGEPAKAGVHGSRIKSGMTKRRR
jgi:hypothetical protein